MSLSLSLTEWISLENYLPKKMVESVQVLPFIKIIFLIKMFKRIFEILEFEKRRKIN